MKYTIQIVMLFLLSSCQAQTPPNNWKIANDKNTEGTTYLHQNNDQSMIRVLSVKEIESNSSSKIDADGRSSEAEQLEFALSVLWVDIDESRVEKNNKNTVLTGNGYTENGEADFAITFQGTGKDRKVVLLLTPPGKIAEAGGVQAITTPTFSSTVATTPEAVKPKISKKKNSQKTKISMTADGPYPIPYVIKTKEKTYWKDWSYKDRLHATAREGDPGAPRFGLEVINAASVGKMNSAIDKVIKMNNIKNASYGALERIEISTKLLGNTLHATIGKSNLAGKDAVLFIRVGRKKDSPDYHVFFMEIPKKTYREWGGIASILLATEIIPSLKSIPDDRKRQIANANPKQQIAIYESAYTKIMMQYYKGIMMTQSQTLLQMQELNYDLLFGDDITNPGIGN